MGLQSRQELICIKQILFRSQRRKEIRVTWKRFLRWELVGIIIRLEEIVGHPGLQGRKTNGHIVVINRVDLVTFDVLEELIRVIVTAFSGGVLRIDSFDVAASADVPLTCGHNGRIIRSLCELTIGRIETLARVGTHWYRCDTVRRRCSSKVSRGSRRAGARVFGKGEINGRLCGRWQQY